MLIINESIRKRVHLLDYFCNAPKSIKFIAHLNRIASAIIRVLVRQLLVQMKSFDVLDKCLSFCDELTHGLLLAIPERIIHELKEHVEDSSFNLLSITVRVEQVPQLH